MGTEKLDRQIMDVEQENVRKIAELLRPKRPKARPRVTMWPAINTRSTPPVAGEIGET